MALPEALTFHVEELGRQHAGLFDLLVTASGALESGSAEAAVKALTAFRDAMLEHTATEEALMEESRYPDRGRHRMAHEVFLADLQQLLIQLSAAGLAPQLEEALRIRLPEWLHFHVEVNDAPLARFLAKRPPPKLAARRGARSNVS